MKTGWRSRGYLPHLLAGERAQFLTWRLADSIPKEVLETWHQELRSMTDKALKQEMIRRTGKFLDGGFGGCELKNPIAAKIVQDGLLEGSATMFTLKAWVVMPNHVHVMLSPKGEFEISKIVQRLKGGSARKINEALGRGGTLWQEDYFDKLVPDEAACERIRQYIEWNPVKAGLCGDPKHWPYSSANEVAVNQLLLAGVNSGTQAD